MAADDDWKAVVHILWRERQKWVHLYQVLSREGEDARTSGRVYVAVVQAVMLYGLDTWVMIPHIGRFGGGFRHRVARRIMGKQP